jgi:hypothetical protein
MSSDARSGDVLAPHVAFRSSGSKITGSMSRPANKSPQAGGPVAGVVLQPEGDFVDDPIMRVICPTCQI